MKVKCRFVDGTELQVDFDEATTTVQELKSKISQQLQCENGKTADIRVIYRGRVLRDPSALLHRDLGIEDGLVLHVIVIEREENQVPSELLLGQHEKNIVRDIILEIPKLYCVLGQNEQDWDRNSLDQLSSQLPSINNRLDIQILFKYLCQLRNLFTETRLLSLPTFSDSSAAQITDTNQLGIRLRKFERQLFEVAYPPSISTAFTSTSTGQTTSAAIEGGISQIVGIVTGVVGNIMNPSQSNTVNPNIIHAGSGSVHFSIPNDIAAIPSLISEVISRSFQPQQAPATSQTNTTSSSTEPEPENNDRILD